MSGFIVSNQPCCVCGFSESEPLYEILYPQHNYPGKFVLRRYKSCGLIFNSPRLNNGALRNLYNENYYFFQRKDSAEFERIKEVYLRTVALVEKDVRDKRVLEVGSAKGYLLALLKKLGWEVVGVEISSSAVNYAREKFGLQVFNTTLEEYVLSYPHVSYPLVLAIDLIEHVPNPRSFVEALAKKVEQNGFLVVDTPNGDAYNIFLAREKWKGFNPFHIYIFNLSSLTKLLDEHGFKVVNAFSYGNSPYEPKNDVLSLWSGGKIVVKHFLSRLKLLEPARKIYRVIRPIPQEEFDTEVGLSRLIERVRQEGNYFHTPDSRGELASGNKGDNFVIIARKIAS